MKGVQLWPGDRMRAFYRRHIERETTLDAKAVARLVEALTKATNRMLVWEMPEEAVHAPAPKAAAAAEAVKPEKAKSAKGAAAEAAKAGAAKSDTAKNDTAKSEAHKSEPAFDPYAFSAMVILAKQGREGLAKRLAEIRSVENLKKLADAQHLGIDRSLSKIEDVRKAVLAATEQRLADCRAAAS